MDCILHKDRYQVVTGVYSTDLIGKRPVMFITSVPDSNDELLGKLMTGDKGDLFRVCLKILGLREEQVVILSSLKCHPGKIKPMMEQYFWCAYHLYRQIYIFQPRLIVTMGKWATWSVFGGFYERSLEHISIDDLVGKFYEVKLPRVDFKLLKHSELNNAFLMYVTYGISDALYRPRKREVLLKNIAHLKEYLT
jgi:uracil-DNA glycosylase family 4